MTVYSDRRLSPHFMLSEFIHSELAERMEIDNTPPEAVVRELERNAAGMEQIRALLNSRGPVGRVVALLLSSGYRCEELERLLCKKDFVAWCGRHNKLAVYAWAEYFARKLHPKGRATDFTAPAFGTPVEICREIADSPIGFDQLIFEHTWVHVSWPELGAAPRRQVLTLVTGGYANGIVEQAVA